MEFLEHKESITFITDLIKLYFINSCTYYIDFRIMNIKISNNKNKKLISVLGIILITIICKFVKDWANFLYSIVSMIFLVGILFSFNSNNKIGHSLTITMISLTINYIIFAIGAIFGFLIFSIFNIQNDYINAVVVLTVYIILIFYFLRIKRFKKGLAFLQLKLKNEYFEILMLNISVVVLFMVMNIQNYQKGFSVNFLPGLVIFSVLMFITIQKSLLLYYKQKMLVKDLEETKLELENKKKEVEALEKENLEFSKISHSIAHKQKSLEYKLNELSMNSEIADEINIKDRIENLNKGLRKEQVLVLDKTGISEIDDMLSYMQSECVKNKIDFQLQLSGNIYTMINHHIDKDELEILLADHIKNAIIAIGYGDNVNKSILVRLGKLDGSYGLYVYDSGIEFEIETLMNLGKKPSTTHKDSGGTGMGFMNTFDTLRKHKASFIIEEYGRPIKDNFTKALKFKFDGKNEFRICSYRCEQIKNEDKENVLVVEKMSL